MDAVGNSTICPVCGYDLGFEPANSLEICPSCGIQFGYDDSTPGGPEDQLTIYAEWRQRWLDHGMPWSSVGQPLPAGWNPVEQLKRVS